MAFTGIVQVFNIVGGGGGFWHCFLDCEWNMGEGKGTNC